MAKRGRPRKKPKGDPMNVSAAVDRHPNGTVVRDDRPGPTEHHKRLRSSYGYSEKEAFEVDNILYRLKLSDTQKSAAIKFQDDWTVWSRSIEAPVQKGPSLEGQTGRCNRDDEEADKRARKRYEEALSELGHAGRITKRSVLTVVTQNVSPPDIWEAIHGFNVLARFYGMVNDGRRVA